MRKPQEGNTSRSIDRNSDGDNETDVLLRNDLDFLLGWWKTLLMSDALNNLVRLGSINGNRYATTL